MKTIKQILEDTLKVNDPEKGGADKYSFTRIALAWSLFAYLVSAVFYLFLSVTNPETTSPEMVSGVLTSLEFPIMIFASYTFGGKTLKTIENVLNGRNRVDDTTTTKNTNTSTTTNTTTATTPENAVAPY